jgi:hypothetical protein
MVLCEENLNTEFKGKNKSKNWIYIKQTVTLNITCRLAWQTTDVLEKYVICIVG